MHAARLTPTVLLMLATATHAQVATNGITIVLGDAELEPGESTSIRLDAYFGGTDFAVAGVGTWLQSSEGEQGLSDLRLIAPMAGPGTSAGVLGETGVRGILAGQLNFPATGGIYADDSNPISFWEATYTAPTDVTAPFDVRLETRTSRFDVYVDRGSSLSESRLGDFADGMATIRVVPAPSGALVLLGLAVASRRRGNAR